MGEMTAIILAGGKNVRMGGRNKAFLKIGNKTFIALQIERLQRLFKEIIISARPVANCNGARTPKAYSHLNLPIVTDIIPDKGPLGGIYSGLIKATNFFSFVIACDMPFINVELIEYLKEQTLSRMRNAECRMRNNVIARSVSDEAISKDEILRFAQNDKGETPKSEIRNPQFNYDVVVPQSERGLEPLYAFYSKNCIEPIRKQLDNDALRLTDFLSKVKVRVVTLDEVKHIENIYNALVNLNTEEEYQTAMSDEQRSRRL